MDTLLSVVSHSYFIDLTSIPDRPTPVSIIIPTELPGPSYVAYAALIAKPNGGIGSMLNFMLNFRVYLRMCIL